MSTFAFVLLQAQNPGGSMSSMLIMMLVMFAIIYFFMIRPQSKKQKEYKKFLDSLTVGQDVVTICGIHGTIKSIDEASNTIMLEVATGTKIKVEKSGISQTGGVAPQR